MFSKPEDPQDPRQGQGRPSGPPPWEFPLRTYVVRRMNHCFDPEDKDSEEIETIILWAHEAQIGGGGKILQFVRFVLDPVLGPREQIVRCFSKNSWDDYGEEFQQPSSLLIS